MELVSFQFVLNLDDFGIFHCTIFSQFLDLFFQRFEVHLSSACIATQSFFSVPGIFVCLGELAEKASNLVISLLLHLFEVQRQVLLLLSLHRCFFSS